MSPEAEAEPSIAIQAELGGAPRFRPRRAGDGVPVTVTPWKSPLGPGSCASLQCHSTVRTSTPTSSKLLSLLSHLEAQQCLLFGSPSTWCVWDTAISLHMRGFMKAKNSRGIPWQGHQAWLRGTSLTDLRPHLANLTRSGPMRATSFRSLCGFFSRNSLAGCWHQILAGQKLHGKQAFDPTTLSQIQSDRPISPQSNPVRLHGFQELSGVSGPLSLSVAAATSGGYERGARRCEFRSSS